MSYFLSVGDKLVTKLINYGILLHASICIGVVGMLLISPFVILDLYDDIHATSMVIKEGSIINAPIVDRPFDSSDTHKGNYLYRLVLPNTMLTHLNATKTVVRSYSRNEYAGNLESFKIYQHPSLAKSPFEHQRIVEVPKHVSWSSVFQGIRGHSLVNSILLLVLKTTILVLLLFIAIRGYFLIKYGRNRRRY